MSNIKNIYCIILIILLTAFDQISKIYTLHNLINMAENKTTNIISIIYKKYYFFTNWILIWNKGISFGFLKNIPIIKLYTILNITVLCSIILCIICLITKKKYKIILIFLISGTIGNTIDRLRFGAVIDFLDLEYTIYNWPAFNFADLSLIISTIIFLMMMKFKYSKERF